ncbi:MAG: hypothetical protein KJ923_04475 [Candidatus Omnitrophica bacterium]|nr:hypothetical protein [Candidatus Omnitrophota bacterium]
MINKEELLRILKDAYYAEEEGVLIYTKHLQNAIFWTGLDKEKVKRAKELLDDLAKGSLAHKPVVEKMIKYVKEANKDAF